MAKSVKEVNYSPAMSAAVVADYLAGVGVEAIAAKVGKTVRSVVAKLAREGVYKKKEYETKSGEKVISKADLVADIAKSLGVPVDEVGSLESATKVSLKLLADALANEEIVCEVELEAVDAAQVE